MSQTYRVDADETMQLLSCHHIVESLEQFQYDYDEDENIPTYVNNGHIEGLTREYCETELAELECIEPIVFNSNIENKETYYNLFTPNQRRILKNLPFAYRGYIIA